VIISRRRGALNEIDFIFHDAAALGEKQLSQALGMKDR
jgi:hypothetical protein